VIRLVLNRLDQRVVRVLAKLGSFGAALYLLVRLPRYLREARVVLAGLRDHERVTREPRKTSAQLRRCIHRLEKGLLMRPRAKVFALDYIAEAVDTFSAARRSPDFDQNELIWASDVLAEYFTVVDPHPTIETAKRRFKSIGGATRTSIPYRQRELSKSQVSPDDFFALCRQRRSTRWFLPTPVPRTLIDQAVMTAAQAPSACNRQPFYFRFFDQPNDAVRIASIAMGTTGYAKQLPSLVVLIGDFSAFEHERDRHLPYIDGSLAAMQFMLSLETLGLSSCPINWPDVETLERRMQRELQLERYERPIMLIAVGYADPEGGIAYSAKKDSSILLRE
jgi:nitroreductase